MAAVDSPRLTIIAGPNGAGKTTFAREYLTKLESNPIFVNADFIAAGLSPFDPERAALKAGRIMLTEIHSHVRKRHDFAFETTLAGRIYAPLIRRWQQTGYRVAVIFLSLSTVRIAIERVRQRVVQGGHDVPEAVIRRRFQSGLTNFETIYRQLADEWTLYDNTGSHPVLIARGRKS